MKKKVFETTKSSSTQPKRRITPAVMSAMQELIENVWINLENRVNAIMRESGDHIEHF